MGGEGREVRGMEWIEWRERECGMRAAGKRIERNEAGKKKEIYENQRRNGRYKNVNGNK